MVLLAGFGPGFSCVALAQVYTPVVPAFVPPAVYPDGVPDVSGRSTASERGGRSLSSDALTFRVDAARRKANLANYVRKVAVQNPGSAAELRELFGSTDLFATIDTVIRPLGLSSSNLPDAYALWSMIAWDGARGVSGNPDRATAQAVKRQAEAALLAAPELASMTDAQKQEAAESYLIQALLITASTTLAEI